MTSLKVFLEPLLLWGVTGLVGSVFGLYDLYCESFLCRKSVIKKFVRKRVLLFDFWILFSVVFGCLVVASVYFTSRQFVMFTVTGPDDQFGQQVTLYMLGSLVALAMTAVLGLRGWYLWRVRH